MSAIDEMIKEGWSKAEDQRTYPTEEMDYIGFINKFILFDYFSIKLHKHSFHNNLIIV